MSHFKAAWSLIQGRIPSAEERGLLEEGSGEERAGVEGPSVYVLLEFPHQKVEHLGGGGGVYQGGSANDLVLPNLTLLQSLSASFS